MILNSSQPIQNSSSQSMDSSRTRRINNISPTSRAQESADKAAEQAQQREEQRVLRELRGRDREVRAHEAAHVAAGGSLVVSGPSFSYQRGPDGRNYAIGGEVQLDTSAVPNDPEATLQKSQQIRRAALAPAEPSPQDLRVAANANQLAARARIDIAVQRREEAQLEDEQQQLERQQRDAQQAANPSDASEQNRFENPAFASSGANPVDAGNSTFTPITSSNPVASSRLQADEPPAAAISAFMATAASEPEQVQINQFV